MGTPFKMKGSPMQRNFGIGAPLRDEGFKMKKPKRTKVGKLLNNAASFVGMGLSGLGGGIAAIPGMAKEIITGKKGTEKDFALANKLFDNADRHTRNANKGDIFNTGAPSHKNK
jgi:hypothetical protein